MSHVSAASMFRTAHEFFAAVDMLSPRLAAPPFGFVAAQCLELALKSYLMKSAGMTEGALRREVGHDIEKAWSRCVTAGLGLDAALPTWVVSLAAGHDSPYLFRYGRDNAATVLLSKVETMRGLKEVLTTVQAATGLIDSACPLPPC